jgi:hypothetical protein
MIPLGNASQHLPSSAFVITLPIAARALRFTLECQWEFLSATVTAAFLNLIDTADHRAWNGLSKEET